MTVSSNFHGISTGKSLYGIMFVIQGEVQGQKVIFNKYKYNTYFYVILNVESICGDSFGDCNDI